MEDTDENDDQPMNADAAVIQRTVQEENAHQNLMANTDLEEAGKLYDGLMADPSTVDDVYMSVEKTESLPS